MLVKSFQRVAMWLGLEWASVLKRNNGTAHAAALDILQQVRVVLCLCE